MNSDDAYYASVAAEIENGHFDKVLWTKAFSHSGGTDAATKSLYVRYRVEQLVNDARSRQFRIFTSFLFDIVLALASSVGIGLFVHYPFIWFLSAGQSGSHPLVGTVVFVAVLPLAFIHFRQLRRRRSASDKVTPNDRTL